MLKWLADRTGTSELAKNRPVEPLVCEVDGNKHGFRLRELYGFSIKIGRYVPLGTQNNLITCFSRNYSQREVLGVVLLAVNSHVASDFSYSNPFIDLAFCYGSMVVHEIWSKFLPSLMF